jgi:hypothetical protein
MSGLRDRLQRGGERVEAPGPVPDPVRDAEARFWGAVALARAGRDAEAVTGYLAAADGWEAAARLDAALDACMRAVRLAPGEPRIHERMIRIYRTRQRPDLVDERLTALARLRAAEGGGAAGV